MVILNSDRILAEQASKINLQAGEWAHPIFRNNGKGVVWPKVDKE